VYWSFCNFYNMGYKREVIICLGSSCYARGNSSLLDPVREFLRKNKLVDKVNFHGDRCFGECCEGPNLRIGTKLYNNVTSDNVYGILHNALADLIEMNDGE